jgi:hypothetical protein
MRWDDADLGALLRMLPPAPEDLVAAVIELPALLPIDEMGDDFERFAAADNDEGAPIDAVAGDLLDDDNHAPSGEEDFAAQDGEVPDQDDDWQHD